MSKSCGITNKNEHISYMKNLFILILPAMLMATGCTSQKKLAYLNNLPQPTGEETFTMNIPDYKIQPRDILYISAKAMSPDGTIKDFLSPQSGSVLSSSTQGETSGFYSGYDVDLKGNITIPVVGQLNVGGLTLVETKKVLQAAISKVFNNSTVECKLLSFKFTVLGEVRGPGTYFNFNNYLTVLEAIGRAGGVGDFGNRNNVLVVRTIDKGTKTFRLNLQDKNILSSEAYFLLPNDVVIIEPLKQKIFNMNLPTISFAITTFTSVITMTLLLINYLK
jgi:polysaccharide export outer membrane protein